MMPIVKWTLCISFVNRRPSTFFQPKQICLAFPYCSAYFQMLSFSSKAVSSAGWKPYNLDHDKQLHNSVLNCSEITHGLLHVVLTAFVAIRLLPHFISLYPARRCVLAFSRFLMSMSTLTRHPDVGWWLWRHFAMHKKREVRVRGDLTTIISKTYNLTLVVVVQIKDGCQPYIAVVSKIAGTSKRYFAICYCCTQSISSNALGSKIDVDVSRIIFELSSHEVHKAFGKDNGHRQSCLLHVVLCSILSIRIFACWKILLASCNARLP